MWRLTRLCHHNYHDKARTGHNFASDTLTKVYRDAVYAPDPRHQSHPFFPEWQATSGAPDVTNHVGNLGVMSARAAALRQQDADDVAAAGRGTAGADGETAHVAATSAASPANTEIHRPRKPPKASPFTNMSAAPTSAATSVTARATLSAVERLRGSSHRSETTSARTPRTPAVQRHSGVQKEILQLYRQSLRETRRMHDPDTQRSLRAFIHDEYAKNMSIPRKHIAKIEWHINYAKRKLEDLQQMGPSTRFHLRQ